MPRNLDLPLIGIVAAALVVALVVALVATPVVKNLAIRVKAVDVPKDGRRMHDHPIPRMGGLAIFLGFLLSVLLFLDLNAQMRGMLLGAVIIVVLGIFDDIYSLRAMFKFVVQIIAALVEQSPVPLAISDQLPQGVQAQYVSKQRTIYVRNGMDETATICAIAREQAHAGFDTVGSGYYRQAYAPQAYCAAYVVAQKLGLDTSAFHFDKVCQTCAGMEVQEKKGFISDVKRAAYAINRDMQRSFREMEQTIQPDEFSVESPKPTKAPKAKEDKEKEAARKKKSAKKTASGRSAKTLKEELEEKVFAAEAKISENGEVEKPVRVTKPRKRMTETAETTETEENGEGTE